ncbi:RlmE family RNA methyltransferase [Desulfothermus okinawensis JCM 13304]
MKNYRDYYFKKAKKEDFPARSVYKLKEIDKKFNIFKKGQVVLDLGASPGSWTKYAKSRIGASGKVIAIDLNELKIPISQGIIFLKGDILNMDAPMETIISSNSPFDVVLSDMAPKTTGIKITDQSRSLELAENALDIALKFLKDQGSFVVKIFNGPDVPDFQKKVRKFFKIVKTYKPKSSRSESKETFILGFRKLA